MVGGTRRGCAPSSIGTSADGRYHAPPRPRASPSTLTQPIYIAGTGHHLPEARLTNQDLIATLDTSQEWIDSHTGIQERRKAADDVDTSDLGVLAMERAFERSGWAREDVELLVCATSTPDSLIPATASWIGQKLAMDPVAFDVNAACGGFAYGLGVARSMMRDFGYERAALVVPEKYTRVTDYSDRSTAVFFGDSAGAVLLQTERPSWGAEIVDILLANVNEGAGYVTTEIGGYFHQDGRTVLQYALREFERSARTILERNAVEIGQVRAFMGHQANMRVLERVAAAVGLTDEQHWHNVSVCGNQGAAGVITTFCGGVEDHPERLRDGDYVLLTVFGSGFTTGSVLLRWIDTRS